MNIPDPNPPLDQSISDWTAFTFTPPLKVELKSLTENTIKPDTCSLESQDPSNCDCAPGVTAPADGCGTGTIPTDFRKCTGTDCDWTQQIQ